MLSTPSTPISLNVSNILSPNYSNLTGSARKIKDRKTMMVNAIEKWKGCQLKGMEFIQKIADNLPKTNEISLKERHILESYASELHKIINSMETVVDETENISSLMASTLKLELNSLSPGSQDRCAVSRTCEKFEKLSKMLEKDFEVKKSVVCKICSYPDWSAMKVLSSLWINDNFVDKKLILEFYKMADKSV